MTPIELVTSKLANVRWAGTRFTAPCPAHDDTEPSLSGREGRAGDGRVVLKCHAGCSIEKIVAALGLELCQLFAEGDGQGVPPPVAPPSDGRTKIVRQLAAAMVDTGRVAAYLRHRGLSGTVPTALRLRLQCPYYENRTRVATFPAMVAGVERVDGTVVGMHVTYLATDTAGKADVPSPKKLHTIDEGASRGAAIQLAPAGDTLAVTEGIETALAILETTRVPTWAAISAGNLAILAVPPTVRTIEIWADHDSHGVGQAAAEQFAARQHAAGHLVFLLVPPAPGDWLDVLCAEGPEALRAARAAATPWTPRPTIEAAAEPDTASEEQPSTLPVFPASAWRGLFARYREAMAGVTEAPEVAHFAAMQVLAAVRLRRRVWFPYPTPVYPNTFVVLVGPTGDTKKTTSMRLALPLLATDRVRVCQGGGSTEALGDWMTVPEGNAPVAHLLQLEELATLLKPGRWDGSTVLQFLTQTFDCPQVWEVKYRKSPIRIVEPTPSLYAATTAEWLWRSLAEEDIYGGFGNRLAFFVGPPQPPIALPEPPDPARLDAIQAAFLALDHVHVGQCQMTADARAVFTDFYGAWRATTYDPLVMALTRRIPLFAVKLALTYAALEGTAPYITVEQITAAIEVGLYQITCAEWLVAQRHATTTQARCEAAICRALFPRKQLPGWQLARAIGGRFTADDLQRALRALLAIGTVVPVGAGDRGAPIYGLRETR